MRSANDRIEIIHVLKVKCHLAWASVNVIQQGILEVELVEEQLGYIIFNVRT